MKLCNNNYLKGKRILVVILSLLLIFSLMPTSVLQSFAVSEEPIATLFFASDYQEKTGYGKPKENLSALMDAVNKSGKGENVDTAVFCGDFSSSGHNYDTNVSSYTSDIKTLVNQKFSASTDSVMLQGNHDIFNSDMSSTGAHVYDNYIVYVMNTKDANPWRQGAAGAKSTVQTAANNLKTYLNGLISSGDKRPVFIATHVPLHMSSRTSSKYGDVGDNMYSSYLFNVINEAGKELDIVYLYGHNHSWGWDSYLGGSSVYRTKGDILPVPDCNGVTTKYTDKYTNETLTFTYMNAGYVGYYSENTAPADDTLTCSVVEIYSDHMTVTRYDKDGQHKLGSQGAYNTSAKNGDYNDAKGFPNGTQTAYSVVSNDTSSPQNINRINAVAATINLSLKGYSATAEIGSTANVRAVLSNADAVSYKWTTSDSSIAKLLETDKSAVRVEYNKKGSAEITCTVKYNDGNDNEQTITKSYTVTVNADAGSSSGIEYTKVTSTSDLTAGDGYLIIYNNKKLVSQVIKTDNGRTGLVAYTAVDEAGNKKITSDHGDSEWTLESNGDGKWYLKKGSEYLKLATTTDYTASFVSNESSGTAFSINESGDYFNFLYNSNSNYKMQFSTERNLVYGYNSGATTTNFYIYKKTTSSSGATATIKEANGSAVAAEYSKGTTQRFMADLTGIEEVSSYSWSVGDSSIAELTDKNNASPNLKFKKAGTTTLSLTLEYKDGSETKTVTGRVSITVGEDQVDIKKGDRIITDVLQRRYGVSMASTEVLSALIDVNGTVESVEWDSSNTGVATISKGNGNDGNIHFTGSEGYTYITMTVRGKDASGNPFTYVRGVTYFATPDSKAPSTDDYPEYPNEGSIAVDKYTESVDFATTGVARVNLEIDGIAASKPQDVVFVVDMSSSMTGGVDGKTRVEVVNESLRKMIDVLLGDNTDGTASQNRVAVVAFNNYDYYKISEDNTVSNYSPGTENTGGYNHSGGKNPVISRLVGVEEKDSLKQDIQSGCIADNCSNGTNYDLGLQEAYNILAAAKSSPGYDRDQTVIFMSDGAPYQYNYFRGHSGSGDNAGKGLGWMAWLNGNESHSDIASLLGDNTYAKTYFNTDGKNYWAEAIKSETAGNKVIDPYNGTSGLRYVRQVDGLGARIYSVGFCLAADAEVTLEQEKHTLTEVAGAGSRTFFANDSNELGDVFAKIGNELIPAATETLVEDKIGAAYDIQYSNTVTVGGNKIDLRNSQYIGEAPYMEVFTTNLADDRRVISGTKESVEKVTFTTDASGKITGATSTALPQIDNIYSGGKVNAKYFTLDTETEIITWNAGTILGSKRYSLSYYVSLNGATDGTCEAGSYATNKSAIISYKNYLGNTCSMDFPVPYMAWKAANITYEFYLVNQNGQPVNRDGAVVNFEQRVTFFTKTDTVLLNRENEAKAQLLAKDKLPIGYKLFNEDTAYYVNIGSGSNASSSYVSDIDTQTTFVYRPTGAEYDESDFTYEGRNYNLKVNGLADYSNTYVAFAVVRIPEFVERSVTKVWDDEDNKYNQRPDSVEVQLYADGKECGDPVILNEDNSWSYTWSNLYKYQYKNGVPTDDMVNYTVLEKSVDGYTPKVTQDNGVFTITNTFGVHSLKITKENESGEKLKGAGFRVYKDPDCQQPADIFLDNAFNVALKTAADASVQTGDDGTLMFYGLKAGTYYIKEFRTPNGYTLLEDTLKLVIADDGTVTVTNSGGTYPATVDDNNVISLTVTNRQLVVDVPFTAGTGIYIFLIGSIALMAVAVVLLTMKRRSMHS